MSIHMDAGNTARQLKATEIGKNYWAVRVANASELASVPLVTEYVHAHSAEVAVYIVAQRIRGE